MSCCHAYGDFGEDAMKVSTNARSERNAAIMRQRQLGKDTSTIAAEFGVTRARIFARSSNASSFNSTGMPHS